jgi:hypothetical protein
LVAFGFALTDADGVADVSGSSMVVAGGRAVIAAVADADGAGAEAAGSVDSALAADEAVVSGECPMMRRATARPFATTKPRADDETASTTAPTRSAARATYQSFDRRVFFLAATRFSASTKSGVSWIRSVGPDSDGD